MPPDLWEYCIELEPVGDCLILDISLNEEGGGEWIEGGGWLSALGRLRDDLLEGDYRALYLAWLIAAELQDAGDAELEPPVTSGLGELSPPLVSFVELFGLDEHLLQAAAGTSPQRGQMPGIPPEEAITRLAPAERDAFPSMELRAGLVRLARGEAHLSLALNRRLQELAGAPQPAVAAPRRTWGELRATAERLQREAKRRAAEAAEAKRIAELRAFAPREAEAWRDVLALIEEKKPASYDKAVALLVRLRDLADYQGRATDLRMQVANLQERCANWPALRDRLQRAGLLRWQPGWKDEMNRDDLLRLIAHGEGPCLEFKRSLAELEDGVRTVAAFANADGGTLLFGVRPDGAVVGVTLGANTREQVVNAIVDNTDPPLYPRVDYAEVDGRTVIVVTVAAGPDRPHLAYGRAYRRVGAVKAQLSRDEQRRLLLENRPRFDDQPAAATPDDIDAGRVRRFLEIAVRRGRLSADSADLPVIEALRRLNALRAVDDRLAPTMAAVLMFARDPQQFAPQSTVGLARFPGTTKGTTQIVDRADVTGNLAEIIDRAEAFVRRNTRIASKIYHAQRMEITEYPYPAVREAIANAVIHRDYWQTGSRPQVAVYSDRIEVESPGELLPPITVETLGQTPPVWRNPDLAALLYRMGYIEQFGTGIERMRRDMRAHGLSEPRFEGGPGWFRVVFPGPGEHILDLIPEEGITDLRALGLNERQIEALALMVNEGRRLTNREYRNLFRVAVSTAQRDLEKLVHTGWVQQIGQGRSLEYRASGT